MPNLVIIGSGPAGLTAAIYAARGGLQVKVVEGSTPGGQLMLTAEVENYPGFPQPILGPDLVGLMRKQAERFGAEFIPGDATGVDFTKRPFQVKADRPYEADAVIVATGASPRWLGLESEKRLRGRGVSSCATCDGYFFKDRDVIVVGGGDTAVEEAIFLSKITRNVTVVHRRDELRAARLLQERAFKTEKIKFLWSSVVEEILGVDRVEGVKVKDLKTRRLNTYRCDAVFVAIGHTPNTEIFKGQLELDDAGYVKTEAMTRTSREGVFAAGDVTDHVYRQAVTAAGSGCQAAIDAIKYLESAEV
ncbi:MAG: thioredoxin-disulfide reductase [Candidatus Bathyarchaeia archaeon]